jgi:hypothetical protein
MLHTLPDSRFSAVRIQIVVVVQIALELLSHLFYVAVVRSNTFVDFLLPQDARIVLNFSLNETACPNCGRAIANAPKKSQTHGTTKEKGFGVATGCSISRSISLFL